MKIVLASDMRALRCRAKEIAGHVGALSWKDGILTPESQSRFLLEMQRIMKENRVTGASLVLVHDRKPKIYPFGMAHIRPHDPVRTDTCFRMASITKLVVTFGFFSLLEEGLLSLDTDVSEILGFPLRHPSYPQVAITARMLMTHTSGITDFGSYGKVSPDHPPPLNELLKRSDCWRATAPGESFHYSNLGAGITGVLMEIVSHLPLADMMHLRIFEPLGIRATLDPRRVTPKEDLADGYRIPRLPFLPPHCVYNASRLSSRPEEIFDPKVDYFSGSGRLIADGRGAADLLSLLLSKEDTPVLSRASLQEMRTLQDGHGGIAYAGRGLNVAFLPGVFPGRTLLGHQGVAYGMCAELFGDPETGDGAVVLTNGMNLHKRREPFTAGGFDLLALAFSALAS